MDTPDRSTAAAFPRYLTGEVLAASVALQWPGLYARRWRLPRVVDRFLVPATPEAHISCNLRAWRNFRSGTWVGHGSLGGSAQATCLSRARARPTKCSSNHH